MTLVGILRDGGREIRVTDDGLSCWCALVQRHDRCAHRVGGPQEDGVFFPAAAGIPAHVWRCGCPCHGVRGAVDGAQLALVLDVPP